MRSKCGQYEVSSPFRFMPAAEISGANLFAKYHSALSESGIALHSLEGPE